MCVYCQVLVWCDSVMMVNIVFTIFFSMRNAICLINMIKGNVEAPLKVRPNKPKNPWKFPPKSNSKLAV